MKRHQRSDQRKPFCPTGYALPGDAWRGWTIHGDTLWSPEGKPFRAHEMAWLSLTFAMARNWRRGYEERFQAALLSGSRPRGAPADAVERLRRPLVAIKGAGLSFRWWWR